MANDFPKNNTKQFIGSLGWIAVGLPIMGLLNPFWLLNQSFPNNWDNNKETILNTYYPSKKIILINEKIILVYIKKLFYVKNK